MKAPLYLRFLNKDIPSGVVVFLVALPLCLGIALASGAPLFSGLITGMVGGIIVSMISGSQLSVSGPAAGLTVVVLNAINELGSFEAFLVSVVAAGIIQIALGVIKAGIIGLYFPSSVIRGMLAAIGIILIVKQVPYFFGMSSNAFGEMKFLQLDGRNVFTEIASLIRNLDLGSLVIGAMSLLTIFIVDHPGVKKYRFIHLIPGSLIAVFLATLTKLVFDYIPFFTIEPVYLVNIPIIKGQESLIRAMNFPDFSAVLLPKVWGVALTIAVVASLETLLSLEAVDKLDPEKRHSPKNRELIAQGIGNSVSGLLGGLPMTAVIVRSSANVESGARTKMSSFFHGLFIIGAVFLVPRVINQIPLSALAAVLLVVGYKLVKPSLIKKVVKLGFHQWMPFFTTIVVALITDLLIGIFVGLSTAIFFILQSNYRRSFFHFTDTHSDTGRHNITIKLSENVSFLNKANLQNFLDHVPPASLVVIDGGSTSYLDYDSWEVIKTFERYARNKQIEVQLINIPEFTRK